MKDLDPLDDAIDRTVRGMTHVAADDDAAAVARVMARLRETDGRRAEKSERWTFAPRLAWGGAAALLLIAIVAGSWLRSFNPSSGPTPSAPSTPSARSAPSAQAHAVREIPTPAADTPSTMHATTARITRGRMVRPSSVASGEADASARRARDAQSELSPLESDIAIASITPAPLGDAPAIYVEPLVTSSMQVDAIPLPSIEMPPVSPERQE